MVQIQRPQFPDDDGYPISDIQFNGRELTWSTIQSYVNQKIQLIKETRALTGWGLKEAKEFVDEVFERPEKNRAYDYYYAMCRALGLPLETPRSLMSKADLLAIIDDVLEHAEHLYFQDPLDCLEVWIKNVRKMGGLNTLYRKMYKVVDKL